MSRYQEKFTPVTYTAPLFESTVCWKKDTGVFIWKHFDN